jgi:hypothetical protein
LKEFRAITHEPVADGVVRLPRLTVLILEDDGDARAGGSQVFDPVVQRTIDWTVCVRHINED